jgi:hypothetical protein
MPLPHAIARRPERAVILCAIVGVHVVMFALLTVSPATRLIAVGPSMIVTFIRREERKRLPESVDRMPASPSPTRRAAPVTPPVPEAATSQSETAPEAIDWLLAAEQAAQRQIEEYEDTRRRGSAFGVPQTDLGRRLAPQHEPAPEFGWSHAATNRIEPLEDGGTMVWINDRCAIVFAVFIFPVCSLGKIEARGDLFEHMRDPPRLGRESPAP